MSCENCSSFQAGGGNWSKGYCSYWKTYVYPNETCQYESSSSSGGCYLTTACIKARGLGDKCYELETLRSFRDGWMARQSDGMTFIKEYYAIAPKIVDSINSLPNADDIWNSLYSTIAECVCLIGNGKIDEKYLVEAFEKYKSMTLHLKQLYLNE